MRWPWVRRAEEPSNTSLSIADPTLAALFTPGGLVRHRRDHGGRDQQRWAFGLYRGVSA
jgi:hypothetical protein